MIATLKKIKRSLSPLYYRLHQLYFSLAGHRVQCNICGYKANHLQSDVWHAHSICPRCESSIRQRLLWACLSEHQKFNHTNLIQNKAVLHFAPEKCFRDFIKDKAAIYHSADFFAEGYHYPNITYNLDISNMQSIADNTYDCLIACDVLEHVNNDQKALSEISRVLKPNGVCILTVPQKDHLEITDEDLSITDPKEREKRFGQSDHLRIYGFDFLNKIQSAGLQCDIVDEQYFGKDYVKKHVIFPEILSNHPMATNYRKFYFGKK